MSLSRNMSINWKDHPILWEVLSNVIERKYVRCFTWVDFLQREILISVPML